MKKYLPKILIGLVLVGGFALSANSTLAVMAPVPIKFESGCGSSNTSPAPLFSEANFVPGDSKTCWIKATNLSLDKTEKVIVEARKFSDPIPDNDLARALNIEIKNNVPTLYGVTSLYNFFKDSGDPLGPDDKEIYLSDLVPGEMRKYDITISFPADKGNDWQGKTTGFDIIWGFQLQGNGGVTTTTFQSDNPGGGGGMGEPINGPMFEQAQGGVGGEGQVAGTSTTGGGLAQGGGMIGGASTGTGDELSGETPSPSPTGLAGEANILSAFGGIFSLWWIWLILIIIALLILIRLLLRRDNKKE